MSAMTAEQTAIWNSHPRWHPLRFEVVVGECWIWLGYVSPDGYGQAAREGAHRMVYRRLVGPIPEGWEVDHLCYVPACVNPDHLEAVTPAENQRRKNERITHCKNGHEYNATNTRRSAKRKRTCRICEREGQRRYRARRRKEDA